jgi:glycosyltransferase involved in cell wall biosynthesis
MHPKAPILGFNELASYGALDRGIPDISIAAVAGEREMINVVLMEGRAMTEDHKVAHSEIKFIDVDSKSTTAGVVAQAEREGWLQSLVYFRAGSVVRARASYKEWDPTASFVEIDEALRQTRQFPVGTAAHEYLDGPPKVSVVIPSTFERLEELSECVESILASSYQNFEILLVNNRPENQPELFGALLDDHVKVLREPKRGISAARNHGLSHASGAIVAFTDDDVAVDVLWLERIVANFVHRPDIVVITGLVLPRELVSDAQVWFELHRGGFGRGYRAKTYAYPAASHRRGWVGVEDEAGRVKEAALHIAAGNLGVGANMAFRTETIRGFNGFDERLGAGLATFGGEEILLFAEILLSGGVIAYEPSVLAFHRHRKTATELDRQLYGRGVSIPVFISCLIQRHLWLAPSIFLAKFRSMAPTARRPRESVSPESLRYIRQERLGYRHGIGVGLTLMLSRSRAK